MAKQSVESVHYLALGAALCSAAGLEPGRVRRLDLTLQNGEAVLIAEIPVWYAEQAADAVQGIQRCRFVLSGENQG